MEGEVWAEEMSCATTLRDTSLWSQAGLREARHCAAARRAVVFRQAGTFPIDAVEKGFGIELRDEATALVDACSLVRERDAVRI